MEDKLRNEFFEKHVCSKTTDGIPRVSTHPHNLFEWFKSKLEEKEKEIHKLKFMVENGLGWKDLENDCLPNK